MTTMDGLIEYREIVANATGASTEETDVIRYDYKRGRIFLGSEYI